VPANLTPDYKAAEVAYKRSRDPEERLDALREMYRTIPKHKGTEHLRADIKTRIKELAEQLAGPKKGGARSSPPTVIRPEGAAQVALLGPPNVGKSTLHARLTGSRTPSGPYPFTTRFPQPGMLHYEDISIQLVDLPPVSAEHPVPWLAGALLPADACLLVVDVSVPGCVAQVESLHEMLANRRVTLTGSWYGSEPMPENDPFAVRLPTLLVANKADKAPQCAEEVAILKELLGLDYPVLTVSATTGAGVDAIGPWLFSRLGIIRVYTKVPGKPAALDKPYTVRSGGTVQDVATLVHRDIAGSLRYARIWGTGHFDGQQVGRDHVLSDGDIVELHS